MDDDRREALVRDVMLAHAALADLVIGHNLDRVSHTRLTAPQMRTLALLVVGGECTHTELAGALGVTGATVSGLVDRLVAAGMVARRPHPTDGRVRLVSATPAATAMMRELVTAAPPDELELLDQLTLAELEQLAGGLTALRRAAGARRRAALS